MSSTLRTRAGGHPPVSLMLRRRHSSTVSGAALSVGILAIIFMQSDDALAQCATTGVQPGPVTLTCAANTTTTNTPNIASPNAATSDRTQDLTASITAQVNSGVTVSGFGLSLVTTLAGSTVSVTNNGLITTNQNGFRALQVAPGVQGNFGTFSYSGTGSLTNTGNGDALSISNAGTGDVSINVNGTSTIAAAHTANGIAAGRSAPGSSE